MKGVKENLPDLLPELDPDAEIEPEPKLRATKVKERKKSYLHNFYIKPSYTV